VFKDEIRALVPLSSLLDSWNGLVVAVSNSSGFAKLNSEDVSRFILGEEVQRKNLGEASTSGSALKTKERQEIEQREQQEPWSLKVEKGSI
jgi:hypothetical protein